MALIIKESRSVAQLYHEATNPISKPKPADPAIEQAAVEKRIWLSSSQTKELNFQLAQALNENVAKAMILACQANPDQDDLIRSLLQQSAVLNKVNQVLEGKSDTYETK